MNDKPQGYAHLTAEIARLKRELAAAQAQRDKLAVALNKILYAYPDNPFLQEMREVIKECGK